MARYRDINAAYFQRHPLESNFDPIVTPARPPKELGVLRVAIVAPGRRPATRPTNCCVAPTWRSRCSTGCRRRGAWCVRVWPPTIRSPRPSRACSSPRFRREALQYYLNVEVGTHISHDELLAYHHAVVYAVGRRHRSPHGRPRWKICRAAIPRPSSSPGTTAIPTTRTGSSTCPASVR